MYCLMLYCLLIFTFPVIHCTALYCNGMYCSVLYYSVCIILSALFCLYCIALHCIVRIVVGRTHLSKGVKQTLVIIVSDSSTVLNFTYHVSHCRPRNALKIRYHVAMWSTIYPSSKISCSCFVHGIPWKQNIM